MICLNEFAAAKAEVGDIIIVISYAFISPEEANNFIGIIHVDEKKTV